MKNIYELKSHSNSDSGCTGTIVLNSSHPIFTGHFPKKPVLPGVVQLEIVKKIVENSLNIKCILASADSLKFTNIIDPTIIKELNYNFQWSESNSEGLKVTGTFKDEKKVYLKFNIQYTF